ncbi:MAG: methyltransferase type 11 [Aequorivita sp.]|nr:methyltransferase type 11 [Aequorivita sp.]|tara:strand:+ start:24609 stop:25238 length:630 start_codon:yes stop_codon:yes gene_type:complete
MPEKIDYNSLKAQPDNEDFKGKYENTGAIASYLVDSYFSAVERLVSKIKVETAHEIGAGEGFSTMRLKNFVPKLTASEYLEKLIPKIEANNPDIPIHRESVYDLSIADNSVDLIFLLEVLEHLDHPKIALKEINRVSKEYLILGVPREPIWRLLNMCRFKYLNDLGNTPGHLNNWSKKGIIKLVNKEFGPVLAVESPLPWTIILAKKRY